MAGQACRSSRVTCSGPQHVIRRILRTARDLIVSGNPTTLVVPFCGVVPAVSFVIDALRPWGGIGAVASDQIAAGPVGDIGLGGLAAAQDILP
jgi:hypothetical protein